MWTPNVSRIFEDLLLKLLQIAWIRFQENFRPHLKFFSRGLSLENPSYSRKKVADISQLLWCLGDSSISNAVQFFWLSIWRPLPFYSKKSQETFFAKLYGRAMLFFILKFFVSLCIYEKELKSWVYNLEISRFDFKKLNLISTITDLASIVDESQHFLQVFRDRIIVTVAKNDPSARKTPIQVCCLSVLKLYLLSNWSFVVTAIFHFDLLIRLKMNKKNHCRRSVISKQAGLFSLRIVSVWLVAHWPNLSSSLPKPATKNEDSRQLRMTGKMTLMNLKVWSYQDEVPGHYIDKLRFVFLQFFSNPE